MNLKKGLTLSKERGNPYYYYNRNFLLNKNFLNRVEKRVHNNMSGPIPTREQYF